MYPNMRAKLPVRIPLTFRTLDADLKSSGLLSIVGPLNEIMNIWLAAYAGNVILLAKNEVVFVCRPVTDVVTELHGLSSPANGSDLHWLTIAPRDADQIARDGVEVVE